MKEGIKLLFVEQHAKFEEKMLAHLKEIKDSQARKDARHAAEEIARIAIEGGDARQSMRKMKPHVRSLASSMKSASVIIPYNKLKFNPEDPALGRGAFGEVKQAMYEGTMVAVKQSVDGDYLSNNGYLELMREADLCSDLKHPNIVLFMGVVPSPLCIVLEKLDTCIHKMIHDEGRSFTEGEVCQVVDSVSQALMHLHAKSIIHRDVKPQNILANRSLHVVKVSDFGLSIVREESKAASGVTGTPVYAAPELWEELSYGPAADVYSLAITTWEIVTGEVSAPHYYSEFTHRSLTLSVVCPRRNHSRAYPL